MNGVLEGKDFLGCPTELLSAVMMEADRDARRVGNYLTDFCAELGLTVPWGTNTADGSSPFPAAFLLELGAALRLLEWEALGLVREWMGLPRADDVLRTVVLNCASPDADLRLSRLVNRAYIDHFAWLGQQVLGADMVLDALDDDCVADAMA